MPLVNIRIEDELKTEADAVYKELNITATDAITQLYQYVVQNRRLPFTDPYHVLLELKDAVSNAADMALGLNNAYLQHKAISNITIERAKACFDSTVRLLEDNYGVVKSVSRRNEPAYLGHIVESVAHWRGEDPHWLAAQTDDNVRRLFRIAF